MSDYRAFPVLYVDDEPQNLLTFRYALEDRYSVVTADSGSQALEMLAQREVAVLVCDQRMPGMTGVEVCARAKEIQPNAARIIMTAYADLQAAIDAINQGHVFRYLTKPWRDDELTSVLDQAVELVRMRRTIAELQARVLRGTEPPLIEGVLRQVASELDTPIARLEMGAEQVGDLLDAGIGTWDDSARARQLVGHARGVHAESERPVAELREVVRRLERGQRLVPLPPPASCDVGRVARAMLHVARSTLDPGTKIQLALSDAPAAAIDATDLGQALLHMVSRAADMGASVERVVEVGVYATPAGVEVSVSAAGSTLASDQLTRAFDPHMSLGSAPAGIGLALAKQLVEQAGGRVRAELAQDGGLRFVLILPAAEGLALG
jgi:CheY-like chemotaxis protein